MDLRRVTVWGDVNPCGDREWIMGIAAVGGIGRNGSQQPVRFRIHINHDRDRPAMDPCRGLADRLDSGNLS